MKEDQTKALLQSVTLADGRVIARKPAKVRDIANAEKQRKGDEHLTKYAILASKLTIDGKQAVIEDILDTITDEDMIKINTLFIQPDTEGEA
ncbi:MAG: hypothetical protein LBQ74_00060 [Prevotella sp.]|jgi:hypothetical protein|nr:hypothetical protein [Prevotella sp.]